MSKPDTDTEVFDQIATETDLLQIIKWVLEMEDATEEVSEMKDHAVFLCINLAMGNRETIFKIL